MPIAKDAVFPLSSVQQVVWLDQSLHRELPLYHIGAAILLEGELDTECLRRAIALFANRHDALRLMLVQDEGGVSQTVADQVGPPLPVFDFTSEAQSGTEVETKAQRHLQAAFTAPIDVHRGPLWDMCIVRVAPDRHYWMQRYHHMVADGGSVALAITGIAGLYNALRDGTPDATQDGSSYLRFIDSDQAYARSARFETDRLFWRDQFKEIPPSLIPKRLDAAPGAAPSGQHAWTLPRALYDRMLACSAQHEVSSMQFMLGLISLYFSRTADLDEVVIGVSVQNRGAGDRQAVGMFSSMMPVRIPIVREHTFAQHMRSVAGALRQCYRHRRFPISEINRDLELWRGARGQIFDVSLSFESFDVECDFGGIRPDIKALHHGVEQTPLAVFVRDYCQDQDVTVELNFNTAHLDRAAAEDLQARWALLLNEALADPDRPIGSMPLLSEEERRQVLAGFNDTKTPYPTGLCLHELFEARVKAMPEATALVAGEVRLTYAGLNAKANRLAHHLRGLGVTADARVAVCLERGIDMVVSLLAILKAGGAYVPLDPGLPDERLADVLRDCAPLVLLSESALVAPLTQVRRTVRILDLQGIDAPWEEEPVTDPGRATNGLDPAHLAYIIYTSGSTGKPKGVMIEHRSIVNRLFWMQEAYSIDGADAVLQKTPYGFDVSVWEFFWPLSFGSTLVMARPGGHMDPVYLIDTIRRHGITTIHFVPSMLQLFLAHEHAASCDSLTRIVCSGEALPAALAKRCLDRLPRAGLYNLYGPTEAAVDVTALTCDQASLEAGMSIGRPIANTAIYILDRALQPVAPGMVGELHIGGVQVARGYWNRADLSAERFIADPFSDDPHARLYKTGDLGRWRADGTIEYLGRNDFQVKIRGLRIELGEVEAQLAAHPGVREAIVLASPDKDGQQRLVAYYTGPARLPVQTLRSYLSERLPEYMLPAACVRLESWPTTANGKLDRKALPEPEDQGLATRAYAAPQGEFEEAVAQFWQDLLGVTQAGRHDHFFELGGHSLKAAQLVARLRTRFAVDLPLTAVFSHPVLADLAACIAGASRGEVPAGVRTDVPTFIAGAASGPAPLSYAQQGLWLMAQLERASAAYHLAGGLYLEGQLDRVALRQTLDRILDRHDALRTSLRTLNGQPVQVVAPCGALFPLTLHDLGAHDEAHEALRRLAHEEAGAPFDLENGPLIRGRLVRTSAVTHVLLITMHHIVSDGWSIGVLFNEISALYTAFTRGQPDPLPRPAFQYPDYALWQRGWLRGDVLARQLDFWGDYLAGAPLVLELPADRQRPAVQDFAGDTFDFSLDATLTDKLKGLGERHGGTLYMTLLTGWAIVLARLSGQTDLVIGTPVANRPHREFEALIGFFINTLALRVDVSGSPTVAQLLARVKQSALAAQSHQDVSFEQVVERINPVRSPSHHPLFQVAFTWQNAPEGALDMAGLKAASFATPQAFSKTDCWLVAGEVEREGGGQIACTLNYATALFDRATVERTISQWRLALEAMVADDSQSVAGMTLLTARERRNILVDWNDSVCDFPRQPLLPEWFAGQAARTPDAIALVQGAARLTYAQLNSQANRLAHHLISLGVLPESRIAIGMRRSPEMVVGLLAILKAGAAYVPLDPGYPAERLAYLLADSAPVALLTHSLLRDAWGTLPAGLARIDIDADRTLWEGQADTDPPAIAGPDNLAYMIYTSGSTGHPKGVMIEHAALLNYLHWAVRTYRPANGSIVSSSVAFDATITSLYTPLLCGASVTLLEDGDEIEGLEACLRSPQGAGLVKITPAHLDILGRGIEASGIRCSVDVFVIGGEALAPSTVRLWQRIAPGARLVNEYGPTETVVGCASHEVDGREVDARVLSHSIPIGRPIANMRMYVLDADRQPVPLGVSGELYIGGAGVGRGYWQRPELTAERFIADPFGSAPDARLYKTGDLGRWRADGQLEYLGRNDFQVKIRGFRIEPGEIEAHLAACPGVRDAAVLAREDVPGEKRLVAYYSGAETLDATGLRDHLSAYLPDYMLPGAYLRLDSWPLTPNGKLDRAALPRPGEDAYAGDAYVAPQGELETKLAQIWAQLLDMTRIGRHDDFFLLDGNSLLAVQLVARVRQEFGVDTGLAELFAHPVLADFAACIASAASAASDELLAIPVADRTAPLPSSFAQQRLWFLAQLDGASSAYHIAGGLYLHGRLDSGALARALDRIVQRHEALRSSFREGDPAPVQVIGAEDAGFALAFDDLRASGDGQGDLARLTGEEASRPFDLTRGPLVRGRLMCVRDDVHVLFVTMHHIVSDGWSISVLFRELTALYTAYSQGRPDPLPPLPIQYGDYAHWQRQWMAGEVLRTQADFWRDYLAGAPALLELPTDRPRPSVQHHAGASIDIDVDAALTRALKALSQRHGTTLFMTLLAGWAVLLSRLSGQSDLVIGSPVANRRRTELEPMIGLFVNTLALRVDLAHAPTVAQLLARVRESLVAAQAHQDIPFEQVVELLSPERSLAHSPLFQVMFSWQNTPERRLELPGLQVEALAAPQGSAKFDLSVSLEETGDTIRGGIDYATALFDRASVERHVAQWKLVMQAMAADDQQQVSRIALLTDTERRHMLVDWNGGARGFPRQAFLPHWFAEQAARTPQAVALVEGSVRVTYAELNSRANRLAHYLIGLGARPGTRIAVGIPRGIDMVVGLLAVLKSGAAYVPVDPGYPGQRLAWLLDDCAPAVLLTHSACRRVFGAVDASLKCVEIDTGAADWNALSDCEPSVALQPGDLAYMIYTSGSTGHPKGVMIEHAALHNYLQWAVQTYRPFKGSVVSSSVAFDATITSLYTPLLCGASVTLLAEGDDIDGLEACLRSPQGAGLVKITPAHLDLLGRRIEAAGAQCAVDLFVVGGEALAPATVQLWQRIAPAARLVNEYGPTETVVGCASYEVEPGDHANSSPVCIPIGRPIANMRMYVLDGDRQPVPLGSTGELYIGGAGVGRGYWRRADLSAERFVADPFSPDPDARLYKTGDLGRWRADGNLEYLGRNDFQVKIRGFRIEPGEIEAQLAAIPGVREAAVIAREDAPGEKRLVAYYRAADALDAMQLRRHLAGNLPDYMLPAAYVKLASWPLTQNGKLDRQALPRPGGDVHAHRAYRAPEGRTELAIARIWQELLGVERVGRHDHFFELGGHSLLAIQVIGRLRDRLGREVAVRELFAAPELASFAEIVRGSGKAMLPAITAVERTGPLALSPMQQRLWMLDQFDPEAGAAYHMPAGLRLSGKLDRRALQAALDRLLARHDSLRTTFATLDGRACQVIAETGSFELDEIDLRAMRVEARQAEADRLMMEAFGARFDLSAGPLIRGRLLRMADEEHILFVNQHHIVSDGWSIGVMIDEFNVLYAAFSQGKPDPLPALPIQYADYAVWQQRFLEGETRQAHLDFWRGHLAGAPPLLALPTDRPRPAAQSYAGALFEFTLDAELTSSLYRLSRQHGCTMFMTLLAGWSVLMARMAAQDDVVIGTPVANRQHAEVEGLIGFLVNTLALRVQLQPELSVAGVLAQVKAGTLAAYAHQDLPFEQVVDALQPVRSAGHSPLFQVMLAWDNTPAKAEIALPGLTVAPLSLPHTSTQFDLSLSLSETGAGISGSLEYATDLFDEASVARLAGCFRHLLRAMAADTGQPVASLPLLDDAEQRRLLVDFNDSAADFPLDQTYAALFAQQAAQHSDKIAAVCGGETLTYAELEARTAHLAQGLLAAGAKRETVVALLGKRDLSLLAMMIAVLRTGAAFLTLDVKQPAERLRAVLQASGAPLVLVSRSSQDLLEEITTGLETSPHRMLAEDLWQEKVGNDAAFTAPHGEPDDLAYIIFTSGSTGQPKGVMIEQRGMLNNMFGKVPVVGLCADDRVAQTASPAFDIYVWQFLAAPLVGATVHILADDVVQDPALLVAAVEQQQLTLLEVVPGMLRSVLDTAPSSASMTSLRWVLPTGEALPLKVAQDWFARFPAIPLMNMYGPAECSDDVAFHAITERPEGAIPIGRPTPNNQLFVLDSDLRPVPLGVQGEICVAGAGVGRGYRNAGRSSAFVDHPFVPGARFYRTGDLGRYRGDGIIEYIGRDDFQVKIRGCRIELGEVEAPLLACDGVADAVVTAREDTPGEQRLVAYVIARPGGDVSPATLRARLSSRLPDYMVPGAFVLLPAFPRTPNGKLDRRALPAPDASAMHTREYQTPLGQVESALAVLWQDLLGVGRVGRHDNFFELGGHSLKAITLVTRMREQFGIDVPLKSVFEHAELARLADHVTAAQIALYMNKDMADLGMDLDAMSEDELLAMLEEDTNNG